MKTNSNTDEQATCIDDLVNSIADEAKSKRQPIPSMQDILKASIFDDMED